MRSIEEQQEDRFLKRALEKQLLREPSDELSHRIMSSLSGKLPARLYKPIMPNWVLLLIILANVMLVLVAFLLPEGEQLGGNAISNYLPDPAQWTSKVPSGVSLWLLIALCSLYAFLTIDRLLNKYLFKKSQ